MTSSHSFIDIVHKCGTRQIPIKKVFRRMLSQDLFLHAYSQLASNNGRLTRGHNDEGIDGMNVKRIENLITELKNGTFKWTPVRRTYVPKGNNKLRPIGIPKWKDKLVQEVIRLILEAYYEPTFSNLSHGFRPNRSCHTALSEVKKWKGTVWWIEGDIKGCFDNIQHDVVLNILGEAFHDDKFLRLIRTLLQSGYMENWKYHKTLSGTPQGGIVSPILSNIVLDRFDKKMEALCRQMSFGKSRPASHAYETISQQIQRAKKQGDMETVVRLGKIQRKTTRADRMFPTFSRVRYVRYADDFLIGVIQDRATALSIKSTVEQWLAELGLEMSREKTLITHAKSARAHFLGFDIKISWDDSKQTVVRRGGTTFKTRAVNGAVQLLVPSHTIAAWVREYQRRGHPRVRAHLMAYSVYDITHHYAAEWRGLVNYYMMALNIHSLSEVFWAMGQSYQHTLSSKLKLPTRAIRKKHLTRVNGVRCWEVAVEKKRKPGEYLRVRFGGIPLQTRKFASASNVRYVPKLSRTQLIDRLLNDVCELCGAHGSIEIHHINKVSNLKGKAEWKIRMIALRRNTLAVCRPCHLNIHRIKS